MKTTSTRQDQGIPGVYGLLLLDVVSRWGYNDETLFAPFHLTSEQLADPNYRIPTPIANELVSKGAECIILGCTEIPLLISQHDFTIPVFDTSKIHSEAIVAFMLSGE